MKNSHTRTSCQEQYKTESAKIIKAEPKNTEEAGDCELAFQRALELDPPSGVGERSLLIDDVQCAVHSAERDISSSRSRASISDRAFTLDPLGYILGKK